MEQDKVIIDIKDVSLTIGRNRILNDINVSFEKGKIHGMVGRNGSGKTMLIKCICGFVRPTEGKIIVDGKKIGKDIDFPNDMGYIIETPGFIPYYSGYMNLKLLADLNGKIGEKEIRHSMECVGLDPDLKRHVRKYSLGMRQRLGIAQAIMEDPEILLLDEPFNGLDSDGVHEMHDYFRSLKERGKTIILVSHSAEDIDALCDDVLHIEKGKISLPESPESKEIE